MKLFLLVLITVLAMVGVFSMPPLPQDQAYHQFADQRVLMGIPHALNVWSNLPFILVGLLGIRQTKRKPGSVLNTSDRILYSVFFWAVFLIGIGSSIYHLDPNHSTLVCDRLPMSVAFMTFFSLVIARKIDQRIALIMFPFLLFVGLVSVFHWYNTELSGAGDLRLYILVQYLPVLLIPLIFWLYRTDQTTNVYYWMVLTMYAIAKVMEVYDEAIFTILQLISGHSLKHLFSALACYFVYLSMIKGRGLSIKVQE